MNVNGNNTDDELAIGPFRVTIPESELTELRSRIEKTRWPEKELASGDSDRTHSHVIRQLASYWESDYDWRKIETKLNALPQFKMKIDGIDIHFIHVRSKHNNALPLLITHGWLGSIIEHLKIIDLLSNPTAYGASASDAFDVIVPSMPGYGFSSKLTTSGWDPIRIAHALLVLMKRLGYSKFVAHGEDFGALVTEMMAGGREAPAPPEPSPPELLGIHTNTPATVPSKIAKALQAGDPPPANLSSEERSAYEQLSLVYRRPSHVRMLERHPNVLTAITDSPIGLAAFMIDRDSPSYNLIARTFNGEAEGITRDDILDNITLFWLTNTTESAIRLSRENNLHYFDSKRVGVPTAVSVFSDEIYTAPMSWLEEAYSTLIRCNRLERGGPFAALEQPQIVAEELRESFRSLRR